MTKSAANRMNTKSMMGFYNFIFTMVRFFAGLFYRALKPQMSDI